MSETSEYFMLLSMSTFLSTSNGYVLCLVYLIRYSMGRDLLYCQICTIQIKAIEFTSHHRNLMVLIQIRDIELRKGYVLIEGTTSYTQLLFFFAIRIGPFVRI